MGAPCDPSKLPLPADAGADVYETGIKLWAGGKDFITVSENIISLVFKSPVMINEAPQSIPADAPAYETPPASDTPLSPDASGPEDSNAAPSAQSAVSETEREVVRLTNEIRASYGLAELSLNEDLSRVARSKAEDMAKYGYFSHESPTYGSPFDMMRAFGIEFVSAGENIAMGYKSAEAAVNAWMNSEGHRANILDPSYTEIGVGYWENGSFWSQMFVRPQAKQ
ncbi:MAG: hypothetical protein IJG50_07500 [Clostridia bacterium]|nr:hypothetical protein [Clostridia bacterium]